MSSITPCKNEYCASCFPEKDSSTPSFYQQCQALFVGMSNDTNRVPDRKLPKKRVCYPVISNRTVAMSSSIAHTSGISPLVENFHIWKPIIQEHAYQRVQIFYYQLLFYYQEKCRIEIASTITQHGKAKCTCCSAAHSAILPNISDSKKLMGRDLHLYHTMNATIVMPDVINRYDCAIEKVMRPLALKLINQVSSQSLHPYKALNQFVFFMHEFFEKSRKETREKLALLKKIERLEGKLTKIETEKTENPLSWTKKYARLVFKLIDSRNRYNMQKQYSLAIPLPSYDIIREQTMYLIYQSCPDEINHLLNITTKRQLTNYLKRNAHYPKPKDGKLHQKKMELKAFIEKQHPVDLWLSSKKNNDKLFHKILPRLKAFKPTPSLDGCLKMTQYAFDILELQADGTDAPPFKLLSGKSTDGKRSALNDIELLQQKKKLQTTLHFW